MTEAALRPLIVCADDYGISPGVSRGIRELGEAGRLSATGAMTVMPAWPEAAALFRPLVGRVAIGLHLTLTQQRPLGPMPNLAPAGKLPEPGRLIRLALFGLLPLDEIAAEFARQLDAFEAHLGRLPDFIDGHHHSHLLPGVREIVLAAFPSRLDPARCWLRDCWENPLALLARGVGEPWTFAALGHGLHRRIRARRLTANRGFAGFYAFGRERLAARVPSMLRRGGARPMLMVHPGHPDAELAAADSWVGPREDEWADLMDEAFPRALARLGFRVAAGAPFPG